MSVSIIRREIEILKKEWIANPCWEIEKTEGFEKFHDELLNFRLAFEDDCLQVMMKDKEQEYAAIKKRVDDEYNGDVWSYVHEMESQLQRFNRLIRVSSVRVDA